MQIVLFRENSPERVEKDIADSIVSGTPVQHSQLMYAGAQGRVKSGIWESTAGIFSADYKGIIEFCHVLEGSATIRTSDGKSFTVGAGDAFVLDEGLKTEWEVQSYIRKHFMICAV